MTTRRSSGGPLDPSGRSDLRTNIGSSLFGQSFYLLTQLGVLSSLAHQRGLADVGQFGLAMAIATPTFVLLGSGLRVTQAVDAEREYRFGHYVGARLTGALAAALLTLLIGALFEDTLPSDILLSVTLMKCAESFCESSYGAFQRHERLPLQARSQILRGSLGLALFHFLLLQGNSTATALYAQVAVWWTIALLVDYRAASRLSEGRLVAPRLNPRTTLRLLTRALPPSLESVIFNLQKSGQRAIVATSLNVVALGAFTAIDYIQQAGAMLANAVSQALLGRLANLRADLDHASARKIILAHAGIMAVLGLVGVLVAAVLNGPLLAFFFDIRSAEANRLLILIAVAIAIRIFGTAFAASLYASKKFRSTLMIQGAATLIALAAALILIPAYGLIGAGLAIIAGAAIRTGALIILYVRSERRVAAAT